MWYPMLTAMTVFAGSLEFFIANVMVGAFDPVFMFVMAVIINARHLFYGISMLEPYKNMGLTKLYLIFGLTDETYAINVSINPPEHVDKKAYYFFVTFLNHCYWLTGTTLGAFVGSNIEFNSKGLDFSLTALFITIVVNQWQSMDNHIPALIGLAIPTICLMVLGAKNFIPPAMLLILLIFVFMFRKDKESKQGKVRP